MFREATGWEELLLNEQTQTVISGMRNEDITLAHSEVNESSSSSSPG